MGEPAQLYCSGWGQDGANSFFLFFGVSLYAQSGTWVYWGGTHSDNGIYGTQGTSSVLNAPPGRALAAYWTAKDGDFWLFGGVSDSTANWFNDLWKYDPLTHEWTWISGPQYQINVIGNFGVKNIPSTLNFPSARTSAANWVDKSGDLWIFGGLGYDSSYSGGVMNDLWRYNIAHNEWTWMGGEAYHDSAGKYGTRNISSKNNWPGARCESNATWIDDSNNLWLFGGRGYANDKIHNTALNDLWKYNVAKGEWTWINGNDTANSTKYSFGSKGIEDSTNLPPPRYWIADHWQDGNGYFYLYGGETNGTILSSSLVWKYNPHTNNWMWIEGTITHTDTGLRVSKCHPNDGNEPGWNSESATPQTMGCQNLFWNFGGRSGTGYLSNELWAFNVRTLKWTWVFGSANNDSGYYGTVGMATSLNRIPARLGMALWIDKKQHFWVFGGYLKNVIPSAGLVQCVSCISNDMWEYIPDTSCFHAELGVDIVQGKDTTICEGHRIEFSTKYMARAYAVPAADTQHGDTLVFIPKTTTTYTIYYNNTGCDGKSAIRFTVFVKPAPIAAFSINPVKLTAANTLVKLHNQTTDAGIQKWLLNYTVFSHSAKDTNVMLPPLPGRYAVSLTIKSDTNGCADTLTRWVTIIDTALLFVPSAFSPNGDGLNDVLYPILLSPHLKLKTFKIYNRWGQVVFETSTATHGWDGTFNGQPESIGVYVYYIEAENTSDNDRKILSKKGSVTLVR